MREGWPVTEGHGRRGSERGESGKKGSDGRRDREGRRTSEGEVVREENNEVGRDKEGGR